MAENPVESKGSIKSPESPIKRLSPEEREDAYKIQQKIRARCMEILNDKNGEHTCVIPTDHSTNLQITIGGREFIEDEGANLRLGADLRNPDLAIEIVETIQTIQTIQATPAMQMTQTIEPIRGSKMESDKYPRTQFFIFYPDRVLVKTLGSAPKDRGKVPKANKKDLAGLVDLLETIKKKAKGKKWCANIISPYPHNFEERQSKLGH